jgi:hypothetical protein
MLLQQQSPATNGMIGTMVDKRNILTIKTREFSHSSEAQAISLVVYGFKA